MLWTESLWRFVVRGFAAHEALSRNISLASMWDTQFRDFIIVPIKNIFGWKLFLFLKLCTIDVKLFRIIHLQYYC